MDEERRGRRWPVRWNRFGDQDPRSRWPWRSTVLLTAFVLAGAAMINTLATC